MTFSARTEAEPAPAATGAGEEGVTTRALVVAFVILALLVPASFYVQILLGSPPTTTGVPAAFPVALVFLLAALMGAPWFLHIGLARKELLVIYTLVMIAGPVSSVGVLFYMLSKTITYQYLARAHPLWQDTFLRHIPPWWAPSTPSAVMDFFNGGASVPWAVWWVPLAAWSSFMFCLWSATICLLVLVQRQWIAHERLTFPLAQIPLEMLGEGAQGRPARLSLSRPLWLGIGISFCLCFLYSLSLKIPSVPAIPLGMVTLMQAHPTGPLANVYEVGLVLWPWMLAIIYLIPREIAFTAWFLWFARMAITVAITGAVGAGAGQTAGSLDLPATVQGSGGVFALIAWTFWLGRRHLLHVAQVVLGLRPGEGEREALLYRIAAVGLVISLAWVIAFCWLSGCRLFFCLALMGMIVAYYVFWARLRAETGLGFLVFPEDTRWIIIDYGSARFRPAEIITLLTMRWASNGLADSTLAVSTQNTIDAFNIADSARIRLPRLMAAVAAGFIFSLLLGLFVILSGLYHHGYLNTSAGTALGSIVSQNFDDGESIFNYVISPAGRENEGMGITLSLLIGAFFAVGLGLLRLRFWWWPLHPLGFVISTMWDMHWNFFAFVIAWGAKSLVIRYGGLRLYRKTVPVAVGLIVGSLLNSVVWSFVDMLTRARA